MRVIAGSARGTKLGCARGHLTRPATDRLRTSLFSMLEGALDGSRVLDLYAGSGSLGIEALSRGAESCTFVELDPRAVLALKTNIERTRLASCARVIRSDAGTALARLKAEGGLFDVIFVDPPFSSTAEGRETLAVARSVCAQGATVFFRVEARKPAPEVPGGLHLLRKKRWGRSLGLLMVRKDGEDQR